MLRATFARGTKTRLMIEIGRWPYIGRSLAGKRRVDRAVKVRLFAKGQYLSCEQLQHRRI